MKPYRGVSKLKTLPQCRENYKGKNDAGGRKAVFSQSPAYKNGYAPTAIPWSWARES